MIKFSKDGDLVLNGYDGYVVWATNTSSQGGYRAEILDSGNLVIKNHSNSIIWQSFYYPTDTLLPNQPITSSAMLVASRTPLSSHYYKFYFDDNYVLSLRYENPDISTIYWPDPEANLWGNNRISFSSIRNGSFNDNGLFTSSDGLRFEASDLGSQIWRRLTLDPDGNLRLYSLNESDGSWSVSWIAVPQHCRVHGFCGRNGICIYAPNATCTCPPGYKMKDLSNWRKGCSHIFDIDHTKDPKQVWFARLPYTDYWGSNMQFIKNIDHNLCKNICMSYPSCKGVEFRNWGSYIGDCYLKNHLFNGKFRQGFQGDFYLKLPRSIKASELAIPKVQTPICNNTDIDFIIHPQQRRSKGRTPWAYLYWFLLALFVIEIFFISFGCWFTFRKEKSPFEKEGYKLVSSQFRRYTYKELEVATNKFKDVIGRGGSGVVYKGVLRDGRVAAVKKLEEINQGGEEFQAELSVIRQIYHRNLVRIWGFCSEKSHRILVSEYVQNGSLDKALFGTGTANLFLGWKQRYHIAIGVAKGLAYLHHECSEWVVHCDVKPENILVDEDFEPKITDFGLAKLLHRSRGNSMLSHIRGTRGYIAPEWASNLPISTKVDVYSYGVLLLELVMGVRVSDWLIDKEECLDTVMRSLVMRLKGIFVDDQPLDIVEFVDPRLKEELNFLQVIACIKLAASCLEDESSKRPSMDLVLQTLVSYDVGVNSKRYT
ncbi:Serine/threonine-protein kinase [Rhynchospora pubera]|uniref:Receptor-like serine/threonine-protein kinase n=1 Tax=Rhynchospora pubera TaxID=906938 RepID=A0AAV8HWT9_9POAL|nr:Serine/threonine-protein kinase [Rhynchospora pubera]